MLSKSKAPSKLAQNIVNKLVVELKLAYEVASTLVKFNLSWASKLIRGQQHL